MKYKKILNLLASTPDYNFVQEPGPICRACSKTFCNLTMLAKHAQQKHNIEAICLVCCNPIPKANQQKQHKAAMHPSCKSCKKKFDTPFSYYWHFKMLHYQESRERPYTPIRIFGRPFWRCTLCSKLFYNTYSVHAHDRAVHRKKKRQFEYQ